MCGYCFGLGICRVEVDGPVSKWGRVPLFEIVSGPRRLGIVVAFGFGHAMASVFGIVNPSDQFVAASGFMAPSEVLGVVDQGGGSVAFTGEKRGVVDHGVGTRALLARVGQMQVCCARARTGGASLFLPLLIGIAANSDGSAARIADATYPLVAVNNKLRTIKTKILSPTSTPNSSPSSRGLWWCHHLSNERDS